MPRESGIDGEIVDAGGKPVEMYPAPEGEPQIALLLLLLPRDFIKNDPDPAGVLRESHRILPLPLPCNTISAASRPKFTIL